MIRRTCLFVIGFALITGCGGGPSAGSAEHDHTNEDAITRGVLATDFPEAVLVNSDFGACSGVMVRQDIVLTAAHCITGAQSWSVSAPFAGRVPVTALAGKTFDWSKGLTDAEEGQHHDIGLLVLSTPLDVPDVAIVPTAPLPFGTEMVGVGRKLDKTDSSGMIVSSSTTNPDTDQLWQSRPAALQDSTSEGRIFDYRAFPGYATEGDSGGPAYLTNVTGPHVAIGVASEKDFVSEGFATFVARADLETMPQLKDYVASMDLTNATPDTGTIIDPCAGETFSGHCDGDVLHWCQDGTVNTVDCAASSLRCIFDRDDVFFACE